jgi:hypothetical protein
MAAKRGGIAVEENELVLGAEVEQGLQELTGVYPYPSPVLIVMPQHDSNAHALALQETRLRKAKPPLPGTPTNAR